MHFPPGLPSYCDIDSEDKVGLARNKMQAGNEIDYNSSCALNYLHK
jgi:hypothetical protein